MVLWTEMASSRSLASALSMVKMGSSRRSSRLSTSSWVTAMFPTASASRSTSGGNSVGMPHRSIMASAHTRATSPLPNTAFTTARVHSPRPSWRGSSSTLSPSLAPCRSPAAMARSYRRAPSGVAWPPPARSRCTVPVSFASDFLTMRFTLPLGPLSRACRPVSTTSSPRNAPFRALPGMKMSSVPFLGRAKPNRSDRDTRVASRSPSRGRSFTQCWSSTFSSPTSSSRWRAS